MKNQPNATQIARAERMRIAAESAAQARKEIAAHDIAVKKNTERLRALRLARDAEMASATAETAPVKKVSKARTAAKKAPPDKLSDWMKTQAGGGRGV